MIYITDYIDNTTNKIIYRKCHHCGIKKSIKEFTKNNVYAISGYCFSCNDCQLDAKHTTNIKKKYKISPLKYKEMLKEQNNVCAICKNNETTKRNNTIWRLCVDHDHKTNKVRGLLCNRCNNMVRDYENNNRENINSEFYYKIIRYLQRYN